MSRRVTLLAVLPVFLAVSCATQDPSPSDPGTPKESPSGDQTGSPSPAADPLLLGRGGTGTGIEWEFRVQPGEPVCAQLRRTNEAGDFLICDENSEQDFNGDERLRFAFGGLNPDQVPKFVIGITDAEVAKVVINLPDSPSPEVETLTSTVAPDRRFFVVQLNPDPPQEVQAVRGLNAAGKTIAGFAFGPPDEPPSPLPTES